MTVDLQIDLGNVWEMLSAVGTIMAVIISLILAFRDSRKKLHVELTTDMHFSQNYQINIYRNPQDYFFITDAGYYHRLKKFSLKDVQTGILASNDHEIKSELPYSFVEMTIMKINLSRWDYKALIGKNIKVYVIDGEGRIHKSRKKRIRDLGNINGG